MKKKYNHLTTEERYQIHRRLADGESRRQIAQALDRSVSTISREIKRNYNPHAQRYLPYTAHCIALSRRFRQESKIERSKDLHKLIENEMVPSSYF